MADDGGNNNQNMPHPPGFPRVVEYDIFMMKEFKTKDCPEWLKNILPHNPQHCPLVHPGQTRRRSLRDHQYVPNLCSSIPNCVYGDQCQFAHNIYESCLHRTRFRRTRCFHGLNCTAYPCFFPHTQDFYRATAWPRRIPPPPPLPPTSPPYSPSRVLLLVGELAVPPVPRVESQYLCDLYMSRNWPIPMTDTIKPGEDCLSGAKRAREADDQASTSGSKRRRS